MEFFNFLLANWDTVGLLLSNIVAYLVKSPLTKGG